MEHVNRVKAAVFSLSSPFEGPGDAAYLAWHLADHMPEQFQLPGIHHALRYSAGPELQNQRIAGHGPLSSTGSLMQYLVGDPVEPTQAAFMDLGRHLVDTGRFPHRRPSLQVRLLGLRRARASRRVLVSDTVLPWRPHTGVILLVEDPSNADLAAWYGWIDDVHEPELLGSEGVAGVWSFSSRDDWRINRGLNGPPQLATVIYLDGDPVLTSRGLTTLLEDRWSAHGVRPLFAGPLASMVHHDGFQPAAQPTSTKRDRA